MCVTSRPAPGRSGPCHSNRSASRPAIGLAGSSYGAAIALYTVLERPETYRWLLLESPSLYIGNDELLRRAGAFRHWPQRIYVGAGTSEGEGDAKREMVADVERLVKALPAETKSCLMVVEGAEHNEDAWRARLPAALNFLLGDGACAKPHANSNLNPR